MRRILLLAPLLLAACAGGPIEKPAERQAPVQWTGTPSAGEAAAWAPLLDPALQALQQRALAANTDIRRAALALQAAQLQARLQGLRLQPGATLSYSANRPLDSQGSTINVNGVLIPVGSQAQWSHGYNASIGASYELDLWNRLGQLDAQQARLSEAAQSDIVAARQNIASRVAQSYWTIAANSRLTEIAREKLQLAQQALPLIEARVKEGKLVPLETAKAAFTVRSAQQALALAEANMAKERVTLAQLLDEPSPGPDVQAVPLRIEPLPAWTPDAPAQVLERRPDVHRARLEVDAALAGARATRAARYPQLSFSASLGTGGATLSDWFAQPLLSLASNLTVPLIDWRRLDVQDAQSRNQLDQAALTLRDKVNGALAEVQGLLIDQRRIADERAATDAQLAVNRDAERTARLKLEVGSIARADELQARVATLDAEQGRVQSQLDALVNRLTLLRALAVPLIVPAPTAL